MIFADNITHVYYILEVYYSCSFKFSLENGSISILDKLRAEKCFGFVHCDLLYPYYTKKKIISFLSLSSQCQRLIPVFDPKVLIYSKQR